MSQKRASHTVNDISFIIVCWNARDYLLKCLRSLSGAAKGLKTETIVVDNASNDGAPEAVERLFPEVKLIRAGENLGFAKANNAGIEASTGRYVCLINSDVELIEGCVERLYDFLEAAPGAAVAAPLILNGDMSLQRSSRKFPTLRNAFLSALGLDGVNYLPHETLTEAEALSGCFLMARRAAINETGLLDGRFFFYAEDTDWCKRFHDKGWKLFWCPQAKAIHYGGGSSSKAPVKYYLELYRANLKYWRKHNGKARTAAFIAISAFHQLTRMLKGTAMLLLTPARREDGAHNIRRSAACLKLIVLNRNGL